MTLGSLILSCALPWVAGAESEVAPRPGGAADAAGRVRAAIAALDSGEFTVREAAAKQLDELAADPASRSLVADELTAALDADGTTLEVRARLEELRRLLPQASLPPSPEVSASRIDALIDQLDSDSQLVRDAARRRLLAMLDRVELIGPLMVAVKQRLAEESVDAELRRALEPILDKTRETWLNADPAVVTLPPVSDQQISQWVVALSQEGDASDAAVALRRATAGRELIDLVVRDDTRVRTLGMLETAIADHDDGETKSRMREISDLVRPAMAAEVWDHDRAHWEHRQNINLQHLYVDVPQFPETAERATHFDRIDDRTAHCVSGNTLSPGDYPVGAAIPHPVTNTERIFYLVNLPTPRRRVAYEFAIKHDEGTRLIEVTQRTLDHYLNRGEPLHDSELLVLCQLDPVTVSRWVATYFERVPNRVITTKDGIPAGPLTVHGGICHMLVRMGRRDAIAVLEQTARANRLGPFSDDEPFAIAWIAALSIAERDPWPEVDTWLAGLVDDKTPLTNSEPPAELGATAAAMLLARHGLATDTFELSEAAKALMETVQLPGYRFDVEQGRQETQRWWRKQGPRTKTLP
jgi:hypothetical protein